MKNKKENIERIKVMWYNKGSRTIRRKEKHMKKTWKTAGIILGHVICIVVIILCVANSDKLFGKKDIQTVTKPTNTPTAVPNLTVVPPATSTPELTATSTPKPTVTPTPEPTATATPEPTVTPTPEPTVTPTPEPTVTPTPEPTATPTPEIVLSERDTVKAQVLKNIEDGVYTSLDNVRDDWWFRKKDNHVPSGSGEAFDISEYEGYYLNKNVAEDDKVIYISIDCGYGSANTPVMLDTFKKHNIKVIFFVTKFFIDANPKYVQRMLDEGHLVGNHSVSHKNLPNLTDQEVYDEIVGCEEAFYEVTGQQIDLYFRPPEGAYSKRTLQITEDLGYKTVFWSLAYNDYDKQNQPEVSWVVNFFDKYHHSGAIPLMHNDSNANRDAMDEVLTLLENEGYRFGTFDELGQ